MVSEELIIREFNEVSVKYKKLCSPEIFNKGWKIQGLFDVVDSDGYTWDTYGIDIVIPEKFPYELPILIETTGKIERHEDWHNNNGICCLSTNAIMFKELGTPISLLKWLDRFVHDYLANHVIKLKDNHYVNGEYSHGTEGVIEGYKEIFSVNTNEDVLKKLKLICGVVKMGRNERCFCNSGIKYKRCYMNNPVSHYYSIPFSVLNQECMEIATYLKM